MMKRLRLLLFYFITLFCSIENYAQAVFPNPSTLSTGQGAQGTLDPVWTVSDLWYYSSPPNPMGLTYSPALINGNCAPGNWVNPTTLPVPVNNGNWITGADAPCNTDTSSGYRYFRLTLNLPADCNGSSVTIPGTYVLNLTGYVDNGITDVFVNGTSTGISGGGFAVGTQLNITLNGPWVAGINYVDIQVFNGHEFPPTANPYGLLMVANTNVPTFYCSPYPAPNECNTALIRSTLIAAGNTELQGMDNTCSLYFINPQFMDGPAAQAYAQTFGANLISVQSAAENTSLTTALSTQGYAGAVIWIGFIRTFPGGPFVWTDSSAISYTNWAPGEPNNAGGVEGCTQIYANGGWNDLNCTGYNSLSVIEVNLCPVTTIRVTKDTLCVGQSTELVASTLLGATPYSYTWTSVPAGFTSTSATITPSPSVTTVYNVTSVDRYGCTSTASYTIYVDDYTVTPSQTNVTCFGLNNGSATVAVTGGLAAFTYLWSNGSTTSTTNGLATGLYTVSISDAIGCATTKLFTIAGPNTSPLSITGPINPYCDTTKLDWVTWSSVTATSGVGTIASNLSLTLTKPTGGLATTPGMFGIGNFPPQYNVPNSTSIENTLAGVFTFCFNHPVIDPQVAFSSIGQAGITVPIITSVPYTVIWPGINMTYPNNTTLTGTEGYTIIQFPGQHSCLSFNYLVSENYCNLAFGIRDTNCQTTPICSGVPTTFTASGAVTYTWSPAIGLNTTSGSVVVANPTSYQTYTLIATDASGCVDTAITSISIKPLPVVTVNSFTNVSCFGGNDGAIQVSTTNGQTPYHYQWTNGNTSPKDSLLTTATYTVAVTDSLGCIGYANQLITQPTLLRDSITAITNVSCFAGSDGTATVGVSGGTTPYAYAWNSTPAQATAIASTLPLGSYTVTVTDFNLCQTTATVSITQPPALTLTTTQTNVSCNGLSDGSAIATATGGTPFYTYGWNTLPPQISLTGIATGLAAGTYTAGVQDTKGCQDTISITITQPPILKDSITTSVNVSCFGLHNGSATAGVTGGTTPYIYLWSNGNTSIKDTALIAGSYTLTVTDAHLCTDTVSVTITQPLLLQDSIITFKNDSCFGDHNGSATAVFVGGTTPYAYLWSNGNTSATDTLLPQGNYTLTTTDAHGCVATVSVTINQPPVLMVSSTPKLICISNTTTLTALAVGGNTVQPYIYSIAGVTSNTVAVSPITTTIYTLGVIDVKGCRDTNTVTVFVRDSLRFLAVSPKVERCPGFSANLNASGMGGDSTYTYTWSSQTGGTIVSQNITVTPADTTIYTVTLSDACGTHPVKALDTVIIYPLPQINFTSDVQSGCYPLCVTFTNSTTIASADNITYNWNLGANHLSTAVNPYQCYTTSGIYTVNVTATSNKGCISKKSVPNMITVYNHPKASFNTSPEDITIVNPTVEFTSTSTAPGSTVSGLFWQSFGDGGDSTSILAVTNHTYRDTGTFCTTLIATNALGCKDTTTQCIIVKPYFTVYIPNSFTPNGDGRNEVFNAAGDYITTFDMKIFDRWGNLIFHSTNFNNGWNGTKNGTQLQDDVYVYVINVTDPQKNPYSYKGTVTLLR